MIIIKKLSMGLTLTLFFIIAAIFLQEDIIEYKYLLGYAVSSQYQKDKALIAPYFDESFYLKHYGEAVKKSGLTPIDHFLKKGWYSNNWRKHTDPNAWFNTTLYQERLWGKAPRNIFKLKTNPLVDFLSQPKMHRHKNLIEVWAKKEELTRAWLAIEGLIRLDRFQITLHIPNDIGAPDLIRFAPQIKRGLKLVQDNQKDTSFYHSDFIRHPDKYKLTDLTPIDQTTFAANDDTKPIVYVSHDFKYLQYSLYGRRGWIKNGKINPTMIGIAYYCREPLITATPPFFINFMQQLRRIFSNNPRELRVKDFKDYLTRIADGFDLYIVNTKLPSKNYKTVPGWMETWIDEKELNRNKEFSVSFLLTKKNQKNHIFNYKLRDEIWSKEKDFKIPTKFYLSYRQKNLFPKNMQNRAMPTDSKKWLFNSAFNITIENTEQEDYFTEKLLGCFMALTVPIYIGCSNVSDYFDNRGMLVVKSVEELVKVVNSLTPETYQKMLPYLKENRKRALKFLQLEKEIISEFGTKLRK